MAERKRINPNSDGRRADATKWLVGWLAVGFLLEVLLYGGGSLLSPLTWAHVLAWPVFLFLLAMKWFAILGFLAVVGVVAWMAVKRRR